MTMSKEMERLKSKITFNKALINVYDNMNFVSRSNKYDKKIEEYQNELSKIYTNVFSWYIKTSMYRKNI